MKYHNKIPKDSSIPVPSLPLTSMPGKALKKRPNEGGENQISVNIRSSINH